MGFLRDFIWKIVKFFLFNLDPESVHHFIIRSMRLSIRMACLPLYYVSGSDRKPKPNENSISSPKIFGMEFRSVVGLAAGFDKNGEILEGLPALGFGFAEIGTVTLRPQPGNDRPRLFRFPREEGLFNRMGFNGMGAEVVSSIVAKAREALPENFRVGVNIGKNKDTPIEDSRRDYVQVIKHFKGLADYLVLNVSSPNTPGLRSLQNVEVLYPLVMEVVNSINGWRKKPPLLVKVAPELLGHGLTDLIQSIEPWGIDGWVVTNTLAGVINRGEKKIDGGWSGGPVAGLSRKCLIEARQASQKPIISVGGILSIEEALSRISNGADLLQIYTGWIYRGPTFPVSIARKIEKLRKSIDAES